MHSPWDHRGVLAGSVTLNPAWDSVPGFREEWDKLVLKDHVMGPQTAAGLSCWEHWDLDPSS